MEKPQHIWMKQCTAPLLIFLRGMLSSSFALVGRSSPESSSLASMGSLSIEASRFTQAGIVLDMPATLTGASSKEDPTTGEASQIAELRGVGRLRIASSRPWSARPTQ